MPNTDPKAWFLADHAFTEGNEVIPFVDGEEFMRQLLQQLTAMGPGDEFYYTAWRATPEQKLLPRARTDTQLQSVLLDLIGRGAIVRLLAWAFPAVPFLGHPKEQRRIVAALRRAIAEKGAKGGAFLDERLPSLGSHHQKSMVLTSQNDFWAYVGGIDVAVDRWDTPAHSSPPERQREILDAWHDVHAAIRGPAVKDVWSNFKDRWDDPTPPFRGSGPGSHERPKPIKRDLAVPRSSRGSVNVQRLRTLACGGIYSFMPRGEKTARDGINRAIQQAQHYIYIEDQYLWHCSTIYLLAKAIRERGVLVYLVLAKAFDMPVIADAHYQMRKDILTKLRAAGTDKVVCCHLEQLGSKRQIYVHSKLVIVDDCFVGVGSTNLGLRSHTTDSELHLGLVDSTLSDGIMAGMKTRVCKFARDLRLQLWREHLGLGETQLSDPIAAKAHWPRQGGRGPAARVHHAVYHSGELPVPRPTLRDWLNTIRLLREILKLPQPSSNTTQADKALLDTAEAALEVLAKVSPAASSATLLADWEFLLGRIWWAPGGLRERFMEMVARNYLNRETKC